MKVETLAGIIAELKTATPVSMDLVTDEKRMRKTGNPYPNAKKHVTISGMIGMSYENGVNNQLGREDQEMDFFAQKHSWMVRAENNLGRKSTDDGKRYLPLKVQSTSKPKYMHNGLDVTEQVKPFIREAKAPKTQEKLEKKVIWRTPALDSIKQIRMLGQEHTIVDSDAFLNQL
jgi:hypothetical protein